MQQAVAICCDPSQIEFIKHARGCCYSNIQIECHHDIQYRMIF